MTTRRLLCALVLVLLAVSTGYGQGYPTNNPVYMPNAILTEQSVASTASFPYYVNFTTNGASVLTIRASGTFSGLAATVQGTNHSGSETASWTALNLYPVSGGASASSMAAAGFWKVNVAGYTKVRVSITALSSGTVKLKLAASPNGQLNVNQPYADPCADPNLLKSSAAVNVGATTTGALVDAVAGKVVYVCGIYASLAGTTPTITFKTGTQTTNPCDTGGSSYSGAIAPTSGSFLTVGNSGSTIMKTAAAGQFCATTAGSGSSFQGVITYVQQ